LLLTPPKLAGRPNADRSLIPCVRWWTRDVVVGARETLALEFSSASLELRPPSLSTPSCLFTPAEGTYDRPSAPHCPQTPLLTPCPSPQRARTKNYSSPPHPRPRHIPSATRTGYIGADPSATSLACARQRSILASLPTFPPATFEPSTTLRTHLAR
jgi:hypothetical protein